MLAVIKVLMKKKLKCLMQFSGWFSSIINGKRRKEVSFNSNKMHKLHKDHGFYFKYKRTTLWKDVSTNAFELRDGKIYTFLKCLLR